MLVTQMGHYFLLTPFRFDNEGIMASFLEQNGISQKRKSSHIVLIFYFHESFHLVVLLSRHAL